MRMDRRSDWNQKMIVFDMDNTLLQGRFIDVCAECFNFSQALNLLRQIDHDAVSLTVRTAGFLKGRRRAELLQIVSRMRMAERVDEVINELKNRSYIVGIISDSYQLITQHVAGLINADFWMANELQYDDEVLTGKVLIPSYFHYSEESSCKHQICKTNALRYIANKHKVRMENCIAVGDSETNDCLIKHAGVGVTFLRATDVLKPSADRFIEQNDLTELLGYAS